MKRLSTLLLLSTCLMLLTEAFASCSKTEEPGLFVSYSAGFSIKYPTDWTIYSSPDNWIPAVEGESPEESSDDEFSEFIAVDVIELSSKMSLDEYYRKYHEELVAETVSFEEHEVGEVKIGGKKAKYLLYDKEMPEAYWRILAYVFVRKDRAYVISCAAENRQFDRNMDLFREVAHTFRFK